MCHYLMAMSTGQPTEAHLLDQLVAVQSEFVLKTVQLRSMTRLLQAQ